MQITIDPGVNGTGYAVWDEKWKLEAWGILSSRQKDWNDKMYEIVFKLKSKILSYGIKKGYIESPKKFMGSFGNLVANRGDLVKLSIFVGFTEGSLGIPIERIDVIQWKGTLPKDIVQKRVNRAFPKLNIKSHATDSVGLGMYLSGHKEFR